MVIKPIKKILVVDDEKQILNVLRDNLRRAGFTVLCAESAQEGLNKALKRKPDLVLVDIRMPGQDGVEMLKELRKHEETRHLPAVFLSNLFAYEQAAFNRKENLKVVAYLHKTGLSLEKLVRRIQLICEKLYLKKQASLFTKSNPNKNPPHRI